VSTSSTSRKPASSTSGVQSLAYVRDLMQSDAELPDRRRQDLLSAFRTMERALGRRLDEEPAHPALLRKRLAGVAPVAYGLSARRWRNVLSLIRFALKRAGLAKLPGRYREPLTPEWEALLTRMDNPHARHGLSRFARYCGNRNVAPGDVDDAVVDAFADDLKNDSLIGKPQEVHRATCRLWNKAARSVPGWPERPLAMPDYRRHYVLPWSRFPESLKADFDAFLEHLSDGKDVLDESDAPTLKASSIRLRTVQLRAYLSALVHRGRDPLTMRSLSDVVSVGAIKEGLRFFLERGNGKPRSHVHYIACAVTAMARHWVKVEEAQLKQLREICRMVNPGHAGMTDKNRARLRQLDDPTNVQSLLTLPSRIVQGLGERSSYRAALEAQTALAIEILLTIPMRIGNLAGIDLDRHIITPRVGGTVHLAIPGTEVKNGTDIEAVLLPATAKMLERYIREYRPVLLAEPSSWLFPGRNGRPKHRESLAAQITWSIKKNCGLIVNPHLFRHIAAKLYLDANPGGYGLVRLLHGHRSVNTTTQYYCGVEAPAAFRHYDGFIERVRMAAEPLRARRESVR
jgi:integrase